MKVRSSQVGDTRLIEFFKLDSESTEPASTLYAAHNLQCQFVINAIAFMPWSVTFAYTSKTSENSSRNIDQF